MGMLDLYLSQMAELIRKAGINKRPGYKYESLEAYVHANGKEYTSQELSEDELKYVLNLAAETCCDFREKMCFHNSQAMILEEGKKPRLKYVEGYGMSLIPVMHAWIDINGKVVDLTWLRDRHSNRGVFPGNRVLGTFPETMAYFGVAFDRVDVVAARLSQKSTMSILDNWEHKWPLLKGEQPTTKSRSRRKHGTTGKGRRSHRANSRG